MQNGIFILEGDNAYKSSVGLKDTPKQSVSFSIYPNPAARQVLLMVANQQNKLITYSITDVLGNELQSITAMVSELLYKVLINIDELPNGCYFITVKTQNGYETQKMIIRH